jgi:putative lipoprotein
VFCHGAEPAWRLDIDGTTARWAAGDTAETVRGGTARWLEQAKPPLLAWRGRAPGAAADLVAFVAREACTEAAGGGTPPLPYTARVSTPGGEVLLGCCRGPADAVAKPVSIAGGWVRRASGGTQEGIVFRPDGTFRLLGIASMNGVGWRVEGDTLVVTTNTERYPDPSESKLRIEELSAGRLVLGGRVNYFEGTWERRDLAQVTGTVTSRPPGPLPADAVVIVELRDLSAAEAPGAIVANETLRTPGAMPVAFRLDYDPAAVDATHAYGVQARVVAGGQPRLTTDAPIRVITGGSPTQAELVVVPAH